jgi:hypothetical protein
MHLTSYVYFTAERTGATKVFCVPIYSSATHFVVDYFYTEGGRSKVTLKRRLICTGLPDFDFFFAPRVCALTESFRTPVKYLGFKCEAIAFFLCPLYYFRFATARVRLQNAFQGNFGDKK